MRLRKEFGVTIYLPRRQFMELYPFIFAPIDYGPGQESE
jgi:hypothetical protein